MNEPQSALSYLLTTLAREQELLDLLKDVTVREREAIRSLSKQEFASLNTHRQQILQELALQEQERACTVSRLAEAWGLRPEGVTLQQLLDRAGPSHAEALRRHQERLSASISIVRENLGMNHALIARFLSVLRDGFTGWRHAGQVATGYSASGALHPLISGGTLFEQEG